MKKIITTLIFGGILFLGTPLAFAQTQEQLQLEAELLGQNTQSSLELQLASLQQQLLVLLQQQLQQTTGTTSFNSSIMLPADQVCGFSYSGSESITDIQTELQNQGYTITKIDGKIGPETRAAVSAFQGAVGAEKIDGLIGEETRRLLTRESVRCIGDAGVSISAETTVPVTTATQVLCSFNYSGSESITDIQTELQNQGYTITKIDGKIGPETRAAVSAFQGAVGAEKIDGLIGEETRIELARNSVTCNMGNPSPIEPIDENNNPIPSESTVSSNVISDNPIATDTVTNTVETSGFINQTEIIAAVRSTTAGIPDDTAVFTYRLTFNTDSIIYIPTQPEQAFEIGLVNASGAASSAVGVQSIVASSQKVLRADGTSYFRVQKGDTMSLRTSIQPGTGVYYAQLNRLSYTNENAITVQNPAMVNYGFDDAMWQSQTVNVLN